MFNQQVYERRSLGYRRSSRRKSSANAWGYSHRMSITLSNKFKILPGQYYDEETGLHYNIFRFYDPSIGRYITSDPIGLNAGLNTYNYAEQNPLFWIDTDGLVPEKYKKSDNPNKRKTDRSGTGTSKGDAGRERNRAHPNAEEHNKDNRGKSGGKTRGGRTVRGGGMPGLLLPGLFEGFCAAGELPCDVCRSFGFPYPGEGGDFDPCKPEDLSCIAPNPTTNPSS